MRKIIPLLIGILSATSAFCQFVEVSYGPSYNNQVFYQLSDDATTTIANSDWDIAFSAIGVQDAGIHINEAAGSGGTELELYLVVGFAFEDVIGVEDLAVRLFNTETGWDDGAFNSIRNENNPLDFGWGVYNPSNHIVEGTALYAVKLRDGSFRKIFIESLANGVYTIKIAVLDGANEETVTIDKSDFQESGMAFFSLGSNSALSTVSDTWDLLFTRYVTPLDDGNGGIIDYLLTGVLSGVDVEVARVEGLAPEDAILDDYSDDFSTKIDVVGHDWKAFDLSTFMWSIPDSLSFFVKTADNTVWQIVFVDFEGSGTGNTVFQKTNLGMVGLVENAGNVDRFSVFPNPVSTDYATVALTLKSAEPIQLRLTNALGQQIWQSATFENNAGFQIYEVPMDQLGKGQYYLSVVQNNSVVTTPIQKQ